MRGVLWSKPSCDCKSSSCSFLLLFSSGSRLCPLRTPRSHPHQGHGLPQSPQLWPLRFAACHAAVHDAFSFSHGQGRLAGIQICMVGCLGAGSRNGKSAFSEPRLIFLRVIVHQTWRTPQAHDSFHRHPPLFRVLPKGNSWSYWAKKMVRLAGATRAIGLTSAHRSSSWQSCEMSWGAFPRSYWADLSSSR